MKPKFIYVFDALCSWCYAFHQELENFLNRYPQYDLQLVNGGMFRDEQNLHASDLASPEELRTMYKSVIERGHVEITDKYIEDLLIKQNPIISSERPARGICQLRDSDKSPREQLNFVHDLHLQMYVNGIDPNSDEYFLNVIPNYDLPADLFIENVDNLAYKQQSEKDFQYATDLGVRGFPQLIFQNSEDSYYLLAEGYTEAETISKRLENILKDIGQEE